MKKKELILDLAKLVISAAWADGSLCNDEVNALKDLLFNLDEISVEDWSVLQMYIESPATEAEKDEILERVVRSTHNAADKAFVLETLETLFKADGKVTPEEQQLLDDLTAIMNEKAGNIFTSLAAAFKSAILQRKAAVNSSSLREQDSEDYTQNTIYYELMRQQEVSGVTINKPEDELRKLCLATGLLARIANVDHTIAPEEQEAIYKILKTDWNLSDQEAQLLGKISFDRSTKGLDYFRLSYGFFECTTIQERKDFLKTLFSVANSADKTDNDEIEEIRRIAQSLKLSHSDFIDAKLTISREDRGGL